MKRIKAATIRKASDSAIALAYTMGGMAAALLLSAPVEWWKPALTSALMAAVGGFSSGLAEQAERGEDEIPFE